MFFFLSYSALYYIYTHSYAHTPWALRIWQVHMSVFNLTWITEARPCVYVCVCACMSVCACVRACLCVQCSVQSHTHLIVFFTGAETEAQIYRSADYTLVTEWLIQPNGVFSVTFSLLLPLRGESSWTSAQSEYCCCWTQL